MKKHTLLYMAAAVLAASAALTSCCEHDFAYPPMILPEGTVLGSAEGEGTFTDPYNVTAALSVIKADDFEPTKMFVTGVVKEIDDIDPSYGNGTYTLWDEGTVSTIIVYRGYYMYGQKFSSADQLAIGDTVTVYGPVENYKGNTPEFTQGNYIIKVNGVGGDYDPAPNRELATGDGTFENPYNVDAAMCLVEDGKTPDAAVYVKGQVVDITDIDTGSYGNASYYISTSDKGARMLIYRGYYLDGNKFTSADQLKVGDEVIVRGQLMLYSGSPQIGQGSSIIKLNGEGNDPQPEPEPGQEEGDGTFDSPYNVAKVLSLIAAGQNDENAEVYVQGTVSKIKEVDTGNYGNASYYIVDHTGGAEFYIFRGYYLDNAKFTSADQLKVGDKLIIKGKLINYMGNTPEMAQGNYIVKVNGEGNTPQPDPTPGQGEGNGTMANPYNATAALALAKSLGADAPTEAVYVAGKISSFKEEINLQYGNATFYIVNNDGTGEEFLIYRTLSFSGEKFTTTDALKVGDEVVVYGQLVNFKGNTPEMTQGGQLVSLNGATE